LRRFDLAAPNALPSVHIVGHGVQDPKE
jgi:hypothetical protein